jgi:hypothetical protein
LKLQAAGVVFLVGDTSYSEVASVVAGANGVATFSMASKIAGEHIVTATVGATSSTFAFVVDDAAPDSGADIEVDTTSIESGSTAQITVKLVDVNGNAVATSGSDQIAVSWVGSKVGLIIGTVPDSTDADGEFTLNVFTGAKDAGTAKLTVTYYMDGADTADDDVQTFVAEIVVGAVADVTPVADTKVTLGTYTGYAALFVKGAEGKKLSVLFAGKWEVVNPVVDGAKGYYLWKRKTGAGYPATVKVFIDGVQQDVYVDGVASQVATITTK